MNFNYGVMYYIILEEVLGTNKALWFSPDGTQLAYASFNDTEVLQIKYPWYGASINQYPIIHSIPYPKVRKSYLTREH